jgi:hypothetical protein
MKNEAKLENCTKPWSENFNLRFFSFLKRQEKVLDKNKCCKQDIVLFPFQFFPSKFGSSPLSSSSLPSFEYNFPNEIEFRTGGARKKQA